MHYLEETRPQRPLMPSDVYKRAKVCHFLLYPLNLTSFCFKYTKEIFFLKLGTWSLWGNTIRNTTSSELGRPYLCGRREKERMGSALDKPRTSRCVNNFKTLSKLSNLFSLMLAEIFNSLVSNFYIAFSYISCWKVTDNLCWEVLCGGWNNFGWLLLNSPSF